METLSTLGFLKRLLLYDFNLMSIVYKLIVCGRKIELITRKYKYLFNHLPFHCSSTDAIYEDGWKLAWLMDVRSIIKVSYLHPTFGLLRISFNGKPLFGIWHGCCSR